MIVFLQPRMKKDFTIGDKVSVIDDTISGIVYNVNGKKISITDEHGFIHEYLSSELVVSHDNDTSISELLRIEKKELLKKEDFKKAPTKRKIPNFKKQPPLEVDLHIHQLTHSTKGMTNYDMLSLQLATVKNKLAFAKKQKIKRIVFIHGVGEGVLEAEIRELLKNYPVEVYAASFQKYGFGATEVYLYQNPI